MKKPLMILSLGLLFCICSISVLTDQENKLAELQKAYEENLEQLAGVQYKARHILVEQESEAREIIAELQQGADFEEFLWGLLRHGLRGPWERGVHQ